MTTVDTEEEWDWDGPFPRVAASVSNTGSLMLFQQLCARFGMRPTYFANLAVLQDPASLTVMQQLASAEDVEVGMHIHPWNTPPFDSDEGAPVRASFLHNLPPALARSKLETVYSAFTNAGITPVCFRGGRYSTGGEIHTFLHEHRFVADCSIVPFTTWLDDGAPDFRHRNLYPTRLPPPRADLEPLWELPLTLGFSRPPFPFWSRCFELMERSALRRLRLIGIAERLGIVRRIWLNLEIADPVDWTPFFRLLQRMEMPYVCLTVHSSSLAAGPGPYTRTERDVDAIFRRFEQVFSVLGQLPGFIPATASEVAQFLESRYARPGD